MYSTHMLTLHTMITVLEGKEFVYCPGLLPAETNYRRH